MVSIPHRIAIERKKAARVGSSARSRVMDNSRSASAPSSAPCGRCPRPDEGRYRSSSGRAPREWCCGRSEAGSDVAVRAKREQTTAAGASPQCISHVARSNSAQTGKPYSSRSRPQAVRSPASSVMKDVAAVDKVRFDVLPIEVARTVARPSPVGGDCVPYLLEAVHVSAW